jgi:CheY-like chemotaxis protein
MVSLVDDLLDVSRVTRGLVALEQHALDLNSLLPDAVEQVRPLMDTRRHTLVVRPAAEPACICADRLRIVQIAANLLTNAAKYTPEGGHVTLAVRLLPHDVELTVSDNGIGIAPELLPRVFDLFTQAERSPDRSQGGLGLGLALARSLVELHGGSVSAASPGLGKGSTFTVCLPCLATEARQAGDAGADAATGADIRAPLRVLVVDDNVDAAVMLSMVLEAAGHQTLVEHDARAALARAHRSPPQVCLLDIGLPEMDGKELARRLRADPATAGAVVVAVTGYGLESDRQHIMAAGFDHHLVKPVDMERLGAILAAA